MEKSSYQIIALVGTSTESWEDAARNAVNKASESIHDLRVAGVERLDMTIRDGKVSRYRTRIKLSFKYATRNTPEHLDYSVHEGPVDPD
jgi:dodecin